MEAKSAKELFEGAGVAVGSAAERICGNRYTKTGHGLTAESGRAFWEVSVQEEEE